MKKIAVLPLLALALGFAACDDVDLGNGIPVTNPQLPAAGTEQVTLGVTSATPAVADLAEMDRTGFSLPVAELTKQEGWPEGYGFAAKGYVSATEDFGTSFEIPVTVVSDSLLEVAPAELEGIIHDNITKDPGEQTVWMRFNVYAKKGNEEILLGGPDTFYGPVKIVVKPFDPEVVFENVYYFVYSQDQTSWNKNNAVAFTHSETSVYDDPVFTATINLDGATVGSGIYWKILPASGYDAESFDSAIGVESEKKAEDGSVAGTLDRASDAKAGFYTLVGPAMFEFNIEALTYTYKQAIPNFWMAGDYVNGTSWNNGEFAKVMWTDNYVDYVGYAHIGSMFKFAPQAGWGGDFGVESQLSFSMTDDGLVGEGLANGGSNVEVPDDALYYIELNYVTRKLKMTEVETIGIIGGFNGWAESLAMTPSDDLLTWKVSVDMNEGDEWKFRINNAWAVSLGGDLDNLWPFNGGNIVCSEGGTYEISLYLGELPYRATVVKK